MVHSYCTARPSLRRAIDALLASTTLEEQRQIYREDLEPILWNAAVEWMLRRSITMTLLGVPYTQRREIESQYAGDLPDYLRDVLRHVFQNLDIHTNYFWRVYLRGQYTPDCCPGYLKRGSFERLKDGLVDRIQPHTCTVTEFLRGAPEPISRFVLLDHMDWMSTYYPDALVEEWEQILDRAAPGARVIFRSGAVEPTFLDDLRVRRNGNGGNRLTDHLVFRRNLAERLYRDDRVPTYASFHIADITET
jgi:S-adenosylmethionine-diacylglycerol 3-amino-3-carboxypropyl transferase